MGSSPTFGYSYHIKLIRAAVLFLFLGEEMEGGEGVGDAVFGVVGGLGWVLWSSAGSRLDFCPQRQGLVLAQLRFCWITYRSTGRHVERIVD